MTASEMFKAGQLSEAIAEQTQVVKANPADHSRRLFLFELLAFAGELDRAGRQIEAIEYGDMELDAAVLAYRQLLEVERTRRQLLTSGVKPKLLAEPPEHVAIRLEALQKLRDKQVAEAASLFEKATMAAPAIQGTLNGKPFESFRDCDDLFATVLEVVAQGAYHWVPLEDILTLRAKPPATPRDLLWLPAELATKSGSIGNVFLPALYPNSHEHPDNQVKLGRMTDWKTLENGPAIGAGARIFLADDDGAPLLDWRELQVR
jgi:type VI secretion system protein ImpE